MKAGWNGQNGLDKWTTRNGNGMEMEWPEQQWTMGLECPRRAPKAKDRPILGGGGGGGGECRRSSTPPINAVSVALVGGWRSRIWSRHQHDLDHFVRTADPSRRQLKAEIRSGRVVHAEIALQLGKRSPRSRSGLKVTTGIFANFSASLICGSNRIRTTAPRTAASVHRGFADGMRNSRERMIVRNSVCASATSQGASSIAPEQRPLLGHHRRRWSPPPRRRRR